MDLYCERCNAWTAPFDDGNVERDEAAACGACGETYNCGECGYDIDLAGGCLRAFWNAGDCPTN